MFIGAIPWGAWFFGNRELQRKKRIRPPSHAKSILIREKLGPKSLRMSIKDLS